MKKNHQKNRKFAIRWGLSLIFIVFILFAIYNFASKPVQAYQTAQQNVNDCLQSAGQNGVYDALGRDNVETTCNYFGGGANGQALNFSSADVFTSNDTTNDGSIQAAVTSRTYFSTDNIYNGRRMTTTVTQADCEIQDSGGRVLGPCTVNGVVGQDTGSVTAGRGEWQTSNGGLNATIDYDPRLITGAGDYKAVIKTTGVVKADGQLVGFETSHQSELIIHSNGEPTPVDPEITEQLPSNPPDPYNWKPVDKDKITYDITVDYPYYAIVSCNPYVTPKHTYTLDSQNNDGGVYIFPKEKHTGKIYAKTEMEISYGSQPDIVYGGNILLDQNMKQPGDADWTSACKDLPTEANSRTFNREVTLENGQFFMTTIDGEQNVTATRRRKIYRRMVTITCTKDGSCSNPNIGQLEEYNFATVASDAMKVTIKAAKSVLEIIGNIFKNGLSCLSEMEDGHELESWFNCVIKITLEDGKTVDELVGIFGEAASTAATVAETIPTLLNTMPERVRTTIEVPPLVVVVYREAESNLELNSEMTVSVDRGESYKVELSNDGKRFFGRLSDSIEDKIYWSEENKILINSKATLYRTSYEKDGTKTKCNPLLNSKDETGCDQPSDGVNPAIIYPSLTTKNQNFNPNTPETETGYFKLLATGTTNDPTKINQFSSGPETKEDSRDESRQEIKEPSLGQKDMEVTKIYTAPHKVKIGMSKDEESETLTNEMGVKINRPWNYRIYFSGEENGFENGVAFISETGMTFGVTVNNRTNTSHNNRKINGIMAEYSNDGAEEQEGFPTKSPDLSVKLYLKIIKGHNIKTIEQLQDAINNPKIGTQGTYYYPNRFSLKNNEDEKISIKIDENDLNNVGVGDHVCYYFGINHTSSTADNSMYRQSPQEQWQFSQPICATVIALPTMQVEGGSVFSNGGKITTKTIRPSSGGGTFGSWVEYGIVSRGEVLGLASGKGLPNGNEKYNISTTTSDHPLTITNSDATVWDSVSGLEQQNDITGLGKVTKVSLPISSEKIKSLKNKEDGCYTTITLDEKDTDATPCDKYDYKNKKTIEAIEMRSGTKIYYSEDNIEIKGNITLEETCRFFGQNCEKNVDMNNIPQVIIISEKDILIDENVTEINAWLIAGGTIDTCGSKSDDEKKNSDGRTHDSDICSQQLTINGPVYAKNIKLDRTFAENLGNSMAEKFDIGDLTYFWLYQQVSANESGYIETYSKSLAPRL